MTKIITHFLCLNRRSFVHLFTFILVIGTTQVYSQKDISNQLLEPTEGQDIFPNDSFNLKFLITNVGVVEITPIEPIGVDAFVGSNFVFSDVITTSLLPGQSIVFERKIAYNFTGDHPNEVFCGTATLLFMPDDNQFNNTDCHPVDLMQTTVTNNIFNDNLLAEITPNPSQGEIHIKLNKEVKEDLLLNIFDSKGGLQYSKRNSEIDQDFDLSHLAKGLYYVLIKGKNTYVTKKLILQ